MLRRPRWSAWRRRFLPQRCCRQNRCRRGHTQRRPQPRCSGTPPASRLCVGYYASAWRSGARVDRCCVRCCRIVPSGRNVGSMQAVRRRNVGSAAKSRGDAARTRCLSQETKPFGRPIRSARAFAGRGRERHCSRSGFLRRNVFVSRAIAASEAATLRYPRGRWWRRGKRWRERWQWQRQRRRRRLRLQQHWERRLHGCCSLREQCRWGRHAQQWPEEHASTIPVPRRPQAATKCGSRAAVFAASVYRVVARPIWPRVQITLGVAAPAGNPTRARKLSDFSDVTAGADPEPRRRGRVRGLR